MQSPWIAALIALFLWWFSTGAILLIVRQADQRGLRARRRTVLLGIPVLTLGIWGFMAAAPVTSVPAVYASFLSALLIWGWIELAFLAGVISGPVNADCPRGLSPWRRFARAWGTVAYHEMLLASMLVALVFFGWGAANPFGMWTFVILFCARISAKLNLFLGVSKINTEFLPGALSHLPSYFRIQRLNWLFPFSVMGLSFAVGCWLERLFSAQSPTETVGFALLTAITALALLEHWLMVLPLPDERLWRWMLPSRPAKPETPPIFKTAREDAHGL